LKIELITIGDELLLGFTIDTNAAHLARELAAIGVEIERRTTVGDGAEEIAAAVRDALDRTGAVITTGGLGPTSDDMTKPAIAALFGRAMRLDVAILDALKERWKARGWPGELPVTNEQQALIPQGAEILVNNHGSAPGIWLEDDRGRWVAMLPGVPREMRGMLGDALLPRLRLRVGDARVVRSRTLRTTGIAESALADRLAEMAGGFPGLSLAYLPGLDGVDLRVTARGVSAPEAERALSDAITRLRERVGQHAYGEDEDDLAASVLDLCRRRGERLAVAESCTGGLLGARITAVPGSSAVFVGGIIAYADEVKQRELGVRADDLARYGAVSEPVVRQMATGVRERFATDVGVAITGVAGPGGGSPEKPVGTVWLAADVRGRVSAALARLIGDRDEIRRRAAQGGLNLVRKEMLRGEG
jgi:competence/damage-inducible protein CinA-like protein